MGRQLDTVRETTLAAVAAVRPRAIGFAEKVPTANGNGQVVLRWQGRVQVMILGAGAAAKPHAPAWQQEVLTAGGSMPKDLWGHAWGTILGAVTAASSGAISCQA